MFYLYLFWVYMTLIFFVCGFSGKRFVETVTGRRITLCTAVDLIWVGAALLTAACMCVSLVRRIDTTVHLIGVSVMLAYALLDRKKILCFWMDWIEKCRCPDGEPSRVAMFSSRGRLLCCLFVLFLLVGIVAAFVAPLANGGPSEYDTALYHAQAVRWIKEYPAVPGLVNLHHRLAYNSSWFVLAAYFDVGYFYHKSFHLLNSFFYLLTLVTLFWKLGALFLRRVSAENIFSGILLYALIQQTFFINSLSTDVISALLAIHITALFIRFCEKADHWPGEIWPGVTIIAFAISIKLVNAMFALLPLIVLGCWLRSSKQPVIQSLLAAKTTLATFAATVMFILTPWFARNIILSGWLVYPFPYIDLFAVDWKAPLRTVTLDKRWIDAWARMPGVPPDKVLDHGFLHWWKQWPGHNRVEITWLTYCTSIFLLANLLFSRYLFDRIKRFWPVVLTLFASVGFWFYQAPDVRFGYGIIITTCAALITLLFVPIFKKANGLLCAGMVFMWVIYVAVCRLPVSDRPGPARFVNGLSTEMTAYPIHPMKSIPLKNGVDVFVPVEANEDRCWNHALPCMPWKKKVYMRGDDLGSGFSAVPPPEGHEP